jgi:cyclopropane-fatty-acyl-phospholipid synthase
MARPEATSSEPHRPRLPKTTFAPEQELYQPLTREEDRERTNSHYEHPVEFFYTLTGGTWNVYSANLWTNATTETESQEAKLDLLASLMDLRPGQRILDVGCGWGGPLTYLASRYGARGVGLTLSALQKGAAEERIAKHGVDVKIVESHWKDYVDDEPFDVVYTDEVIVHFFDLGAFFSKVFGLLRPGGRMVNKELHFVRPKYGEMTRAMSYINEVFGSTGNYRTLADELTLVLEAGFEVQTIRQMPLREYQTTVDHWSANLKAKRDRMQELVGQATLRQFLTYLQLCHHIHGGTRMTLDIVVSHKPIETEGPALVAAQGG